MVWSTSMMLSLLGQRRQVLNKSLIESIVSSLYSSSVLNKNDDSGRISCAVWNSWTDKHAAILFQSSSITVFYEINGGFQTTKWTWQTNQTTTTIDLPRQRFGEYTFFSKLKIWDRRTGGQADTGTSWVAAQLKTLKTNNEKDLMCQHD